MKPRIYTTLLVSLSCVSALAQGADTLAVQTMAWDPVELLHGQPGVIVASSAADPGSTPTIYIGGARLNQSMQPVYVVDGVRVRDLSLVPASDCESIRVLEGPEAIAQWGPDAAAGVVLVSTRKADVRGFHADYSFRHASQKINDLPQPFFEGIDIDKYIERSSFHRQHNVGAQFRNRWLGIRASFAADKGDGYYLGKDDMNTRYVSTVSLEADILPWMRLAVGGSYGWMLKDSGHDNWLNFCLSNTAPPAEGQGDWGVQQQEREEQRLRADLDMRPIEGLRVNAYFSGRRDGRAARNAYWDGRNENYPVVDGVINRQQLQRIEYGAELGWEKSFMKDHRVAVEGDLHQVRSWNAFRQYYYDEGHLPVSTSGFTWLDTDAYWASLLEKGEDVFWDFKDVWQQGHGTITYSWRDRASVRGGVTARWGDGKWMASKPSWSPYFSVKGIALNRPYITLHADWAKVGQGVVERSGEEWARHTDLYDVNTYNAVLMWNRSVRRSVGVGFSSSPQATWRIEANYYRNHDHIGTYWNRIRPTVRNSVRNEGVVLSGHWSLQHRDWGIHLSGNYARMRNRVNTDFKNAYATTMSELYDGSPVGMYSWFVLEGVDKETGEAIWKYDDRGMARTLLGGMMPRASYAVEATVSWKTLSLAVSGYGWGGNRITNWANWHYNVLLKDCWTPENPDAPLPKEMTNYVLQSDRVHPRRRFFKLGQISLSCGLPRSWASRLRMSEAKVWVSLEDIACWSNYSGMDPEGALMDASMGYEISRYPLMSRAVLGLSLAF